MSAAPQSAYTDPARLAAERARVFERDWIMIGRADEIPEPGDYLTASVAGKPILVMRQADGALAAMANVCLHRYARLLDGCGRVQRIVCPYHAWTYDRTGALIGAADRDGFDPAALRGRRLAPLACDTWEGFVFVALRDDLAPLSDRLGALSELIAPYGLGEYVSRHRVIGETWPGNWKLVFENFIESYHVTYTHSGSIGPTNPTRYAEFGPTGFPWFSIHSNSYRPESLPDVHTAGLTEGERRRFNVIALYPNGLLALDPNFVWWMTLEPTEAGQTTARWGLAFAPAALAGMSDPEAFVADIRRVIEIATVEDKEMVGRVQQGCAFGAATPGLLHDPLEVYVREFGAYLARMLTQT